MTSRDPRRAFVSRPSDPDTWVRTPEPATLPNGAKADHFTARLTIDVTPANQKPLASFSYGTDDLSAAFDASLSSDPDGTISTYAWTFGDGTPAQTTTASLLAAGLALLAVQGAAVRFTMGAFVLKVDGTALLLGSGTGLLLGVVGALPPAFQAMRLPIVDALKAV